MGQLHSNDAVLQEIAGAYASEIFGPPAFFNGKIYLASASDVLKSWTLSNDQLALSSSASTGKSAS